MTNSTCTTTISKLFCRRELVERQMTELNLQLDQLDDTGLVANYGAVDEKYDRLYDLLVEIDAEIASAPIEAESDRNVIVAVAQRRSAEDDDGLSAGLAARLMARV
jgi:hypothetical protein